MKKNRKLIVNNILIILCGDYTYYGEHWVMFNMVESLFYTSETNKTLSTIINKNFKEKKKRKSFVPKCEIIMTLD